MEENGCVLHFQLCYITAFCKSEVTHHTPPDQKEKVRETDSEIYPNNTFIAVSQQVSQNRKQDSSFHQILITATCLMSLLHLLPLPLFHGTNTADNQNSIKFGH